MAAGHDQRGRGRYPADRGGCRGRARIAVSCRRKPSRPTRSGHRDDLGGERSRQQRRSGWTRRGSSRGVTPRKRCPRRQFHQRAAMLRLLGGVGPRAGVHQAEPLDPGRRRVASPRTRRSRPSRGRTGRNAQARPRERGAPLPRQNHPAPHLRRPHPPRPQAPRSGLARAVRSHSRPGMKSTVGRIRAV